MVFVKIFIIISHFNLILFSSIGYGYLFNKFFFKKDNKQIYELFFYSIPFLLLISFVTHFFIKINYSLSIAILSIGFLISLFNFKVFTQDKIVIYLYIISSIIFIPFIIGASPHADFYYHHLPYLNVIFDYKLIFGLVNFNDVLANPYMSWFDYSALFNLPPFKFQTNYLVNAVLFFAFINYILIHFIRESNIFLKLLDIFLIILPLSLFSKLTNHGADVPSQIFILLLIKEFCNFFTSQNYSNKINISYKILLYACIAIIFRINSIFILPLVFIIIFYLLIKFNRNIFNFRILVFLLTLSTLFVSKNFITSGCLIYPIHQTCFSQESVEWSVGKKLTKKRADFLEASSKGWMFYIKKNSQIKQKFIWNPVSNLMNHEEYLKSGILFWTKYWILDHDKERIINVGLISFIIFLIIFSLNYKNFKINLNYRYYNPKLFYMSLLPIIFWFIKTPQSRFAGYSLFITFFSLLFILVISKFFNAKKLKLNFSILILLFISVSFFTVENIKLSNINIQLAKENNFYEWLAYPELISNIDYKTVSKDNFRINLRLKTNKEYAGNINDEYKHILFCGNIKQICMPIKKIKCLKKILYKSNYIMAISNKKSCLELINKHILY